jgi:phosphoribosylformimino-5-aminoimidazole carboxamide ribotide isomerase
MSAMTDFTIIPALDLKGGTVVQARGGDRANYRPIETPLGPADDPFAIARSLLALTQSPCLYIADLDAIGHTGNNYALCRDLSHALPDANLWIDAGFTNVTDCAFWLPLGATLVVGIESLTEMDNWHELRSAFGETLVLSLDFDAEGQRGPSPLFADPSLWPQRAIAMSLDRVGRGAGPDLERMQVIASSAPGHAVYASGGVRSVSDLEALAEIGAQGALIASALHAKAISENEIAAFLQRRRSRQS